jgi:hypothetical protein
MNFKNLSAFIVVASIVLSCTETPGVENTKAAANPLVGTWKLISGTLIEKGDTTVTDYTKNLSFIKIINGSHFAFFNHDLNKGKDSNAVFVSGGGSYTFKDSVYTEHLEYCTARDWEGHEFSFTMQFRNDTLIQQGIEKIDSLGINRLNIERYTRVK